MSFRATAEDYKFTADDFDNVVWAVRDGSLDPKEGRKLADRLLRECDMAELERLDGDAPEDDV